MYQLASLEALASAFIYTGKRPAGQDLGDVGWQQFCATPLMAHLTIPSLCAMI
jgi:hypothetical protein